MSTLTNASEFDERLAELHKEKVFGDFPLDQLQNRIDLIGVKSILYNQLVITDGFPCSYNTPLDEAILMLHYFLIKSKQRPGSFLKIYAIHVPTQDEKNTLSFWSTAKAGLYLDIQHMVLLLNQASYRVSETGFNEVKRIFLFRSPTELAHLTLAGISVIFEQQSIGIKVQSLFIQSFVVT